MKPISRQRAWQLRKQAEGKCTQCGNPSRESKTQCEECAVKNATASLRRYHLKKKEKPND